MMCNSNPKFMVSETSSQNVFTSQCGLNGFNYTVIQFKKMGIAPILNSLLGSPIQTCDVFPVLYN